MGHTATLTFPIADNIAQAILAALEPEVADGPEGTETKLTLENGAIVANITGDDLSGLRAAIHGVARLLDAAIETLQ